MLTATLTYANDCIISAHAPSSERDNSTWDTANDALNTAINAWNVGVSDVHAGRAVPAPSVARSATTTTTTMPIPTTTQPLAGSTTGLGVTDSHEEAQFDIYDSTAAGTWHSGEAYHGEATILGGGSIADYELLGPSKDLVEVDMTISGSSSDTSLIDKQVVILSAFAESFGGSASNKWVGSVLGDKSATKVIGHYRWSESSAQVTKSTSIVNVGVVPA
jgi:hypothetical protein